MYPDRDRVAPISGLRSFLLVVRAWSRRGVKLVPCDAFTRGLVERHHLARDALGPSRLDQDRRRGRPPPSESTVPSPPLDGCTSATPCAGRTPRSSPTNSPIPLTLARAQRMTLRACPHVLDTRLTHPSQSRSSKGIAERPHHRVRPRAEGGWSWLAVLATEAEGQGVWRSATRRLSLVHDSSPVSTLSADVSSAVASTSASGSRRVRESL